MRAIITVVGKDQVGIIAAVCNKLAQHQVNVLDISQTVLQGFFTMMRCRRWAEKQDSPSVCSGKIVSKLCIVSEG